MIKMRTQNTFTKVINNEDITMIFTFQCKTQRRAKPTLHFTKVTLILDCIYIDNNNIVGLVWKKPFLENKCKTNQHKQKKTFQSNSCHEPCWQVLLAEISIFLEIQQNCSSPVNFAADALLTSMSAFSISLTVACPGTQQTVTLLRPPSCDWILKQFQTNFDLNYFKLYIYLWS